MPTRRSSRLRTAASDDIAVGTTASLSPVESAAALVAVAPRSRRAARQRQSVGEDAVEVPVEPFIAEAPEPFIAEVPVPTIAAVAAASAATASAAVPARELPVEKGVDAFDRASRAFRTGSVPTTPNYAPLSENPEKPASEFAACAGVPAQVTKRRLRSIRKVVTVGATVGVMSLAGLLVVAMTLPAEAVAAVQGNSAAATSLVSNTASDEAEEAADEIQAFVAPSGVENEPLARADDFSTVSLVQVAAEQGIDYSGEIFTNDPDAAIQWPFLVGVGMSYGYGMRSGRLHEGIDFVPGNGAPIQAIADGTVRIATEQGGAYGVTVYIDHVIDGSVITSHYSHMQYGSLQVKSGDTVTVGTVIGKTGNTGRSYGAHLHFELIVNGSTIDPMPWLKSNAGRTSY